MGNAFVHKARPQVSAAVHGLAPPSLSAKTHRQVNDVLHSPGKPLDSETRAYMEPRFRYDFSKVRVHADAKPTALAASNPGDRSGQKADHVAAQVMCRSVPANPAAGGYEPLVQREAADRVGAETVPQMVHEVLRSPGQPLASATRVHGAALRLRLQQSAYTR
jgi:hypothetical protein